jgi:peptide/nickel transport system substrate-binding protein
VRRRALTLLTALALLTGCVSTREISGGLTTGGRLPWTQAGVLRLGDVAEPDSLNPLLSTMDLSYDLSSLMFSYLVTANAHGSLIPDLATAVPALANGGISADGRTIVYHLRRGVRWHDGVPFDARDVAFSWRAVMNPRNNVLHREGYQEVVAIDTPDRFTLVVHLRRRYPPFVTQFFTTLQEGAKPVVPAHLLARYANINQVPFNAAPIGTGPFRFVRWDRGREIVLARNDGYFRGRPKLDRIVLDVLPDANTVATALQSHEIDLIVNASPVMYARFRTVPDIVDRVAPWNALRLVMFDDQRPAMRELAVRRAISMAIDVHALIQKLSYGTGTATGALGAPTSLGYAQLPPYPYDPAAARTLLDRAGWRLGADGVRVKNGAPLDLLFVVPAASDEQAFSVQIQAMLAQIGARVTIKTFPYKGIFAWDGPIVRGRFDLSFYGNTLNYDPDSTSLLGCDQFVPKGENESRFCDPKVDALERAGLATDDPVKRAAIYREIGRRVHDAVPYLPIYLRPRIIIATTDLHGYAPAPIAGPWWNAWRWSI